jgi:hypothetical protein
VVSTQVAAFTLLALGAGGGLAGASLGGAAAGIDTKHRGVGPKQGKVQTAKVKHITTMEADAARGDASRTWRFPGTVAIDALSLALPVRLVRRSPLLARLLVDGSYLRAMLGSLAIVFTAAGLGLGILAVQSSGGRALPPSTTLTIAVAVLGVVDAMAGLVAVMTFVIGTAVLGGIDSAAAVRTLLGLCALWAVVPVVAGAARPLRRPWAITLEERWDRAADFIIASLIGAWAVQKIVTGLPGLAGYALPIAAKADVVALVVLIALLVRIAAESIAATFYPQRLGVVQPASMPRSGARQRMVATILRSAVFVFVAAAVVGPSWQLVVGGALFLVPQMLSIHEHRFHNIPSLYRVLPRGLLKIVVMLLVARWFGSLVLGTIHDHRDALADAFVLLAIPGAVLSLLDLFGREGNTSPLRWRHRFAGTAVLLVGVLLVFGVL